MRVVHVISTPRGIGGAKNVVKALARARLDRGQEHLVLNPFLLHGHESDLAAELPRGMVEGKANEHVGKERPTSMCGS